MVPAAFDALQGREGGCSERGRPFAPYAFAGAGFGLVATANGILRELGFRRFLGEQRAHQLSSLTFAVLFAGYTWLVEARWPLHSRSEAIVVGGMWMATAAGFDSVSDTTSTTSRGRR